MNMDAISEYWENLESRERMILSIGGTLLSIMLVYGLVWAPLEESIAELSVDVTAQRAQLQEMQEMADDIKSWRTDLTAASGAAGSGGTALVTLVDQTARQSKINVQQWQPEGNHKVKIRLDSVAFDDLIKWLSTLHRKHAVNVSISVLNKSKEQGKVDARLTLEEAAS